MTEKELLSVIKLSESNQGWWLYDNGRHMTATKNSTHNRYRLAALAFKLKNASDMILLSEGMSKVWGYWCDLTWESRKREGETKKHVRYPRFWANRSEPIHWIIAALIAKLLERQK